MKIHDLFLKPFGRMIIRRSKFEQLRDSLSHKMVKLIELEKTDCVIDVGANKGQFALALRRSGYRGRVVSFEPLEECFDVLEELSGSDPLWTVYRIALGDSDGEVELNVSSNTVFSSACEPNDYASKRFGESVETISVQKVPMRRLDTLCHELNELKSDERILLKLDTQGYDLKVFQGAKGLLGRVFALQSELSVRAIYHGMPDYYEALGVYRAAGFEIVATQPVAIETDGVTLIEFDCLMKKGSNT